MLRHPGRIEARGLGMGDLRRDEAVAFRGWHVVEQAAEEAEAKRARWFVWNAGHPEEKAAL
ncbi:hypothetical protein GGD71_002837 [Variovorax guangxiensis]|uniref:Uncharacterized protein n=1 Tax=Variovorax guangxiensis TaxID=1775474 RepID=A0A840FSJ1_9BURK|nr:hypothetical protein [Variovorax guangxiensis]